MRNILTIIGNLEANEKMRSILALADYGVETAKNGKVGVAKAISTLPDLIICDASMPGLDGFGVLSILSKNARTSSIPFIIITDKVKQSDFRKGMGLGADDYLSKPFDDASLLGCDRTKVVQK